MYIQGSTGLREPSGVPSSYLFYRARFVFLCIFPFSGIMNAKTSKLFDQSLLSCLETVKATNHTRVDGGTYEMHLDFCQYNKENLAQ